MREKGKVKVCLWMFRISLEKLNVPHGPLSDIDDFTRRVRADPEDLLDLGQARFHLKYVFAIFSSCVMALA
jgi:hypothetical protein